MLNKILYSFIKIKNKCYTRNKYIILTYRNGLHALGFMNLLTTINLTYSIILFFFFTKVYYSYFCCYWFWIRKKSWVISAMAQNIVGCKCTCQLLAVSKRRERPFIKQKQGYKDDIHFHLSHLCCINQLPTSYHISIYWTL